MPFSPASTGPTVPAIFSATTSAFGEASFGGLAAGPYVVLVHEPGFARSWQVLGLPESTNVVVALAQSVTVSGAVTGPGSLPVNNAMVVIYDPAANIQVANTFTDSSGHYSIGDLYQGTFDIIVSQPGLATAGLSNVVVNANVFTQNTTLSAETTQLRGTVTDAAGIPLSTAVIKITAGGAPVALLPTAVDGTWSTAQLPPGTYSVSVIAASYKPAGRDECYIVGSNAGGSFLAAAGVGD